MDVLLKCFEESVFSPVCMVRFIFDPRSFRPCTLILCCECEPSAVVPISLPVWCHTTSQHLAWLIHDSPSCTVLLGERRDFKYHRG